jgi:P4 family phage/plasmid primase-like protien
MTSNNTGLEINRVKKRVEKLLYKCKTLDKDYTHVSMGGETLPGKYNIKKDDQKSLYKLLGQALELGLVISLAEKLKEYGPIKVDIDLELPKTKHCKDERLYDEELICETIDVYRRAINHYCDVDEQELECFFFEKENYTEKNEVIKDGFHLIFPHVTLHYKTRHLIYDYVLKNTKDVDIFNKFGVTPIFDKQTVSTNAWMMYGCAKPNCNPYLLSRIINYSNEDEDIDMEDDKLVKFLSLRQSKWKKDNETLLNDEVNENIIEENYNKLDNHDSEMLRSEIIPENQEDMEDAKRLVSMLSKKRADAYHSWIEVGWCLHNTSQHLLNTWIDFSRMSSKFKDGDCEKRWNQMRSDGYTFKSLHYWAKHDSKKKYDDFMKEKRLNVLKKNGPKNHFMTAKALYEIYKCKFVCADVEKNIWYRFEGHRWHRDPNAGTLNMLISEEFTGYYRELRRKLCTQDFKTRDEEKLCNEQIKDCSKIIEFCYDDGFKDKVIKQAKYIFKDEKFLELMDEKYNLVCFENGVLDLNTGKFRNGQPDDNITMSTKNNYIPWHETNPYAIEIQKFFSEILTNDDVKRYFLTRLALCISGENKEEKFYFLTGSGSNGKSLTFSLLDLALGDYYVSCPITIITKKRNASNAASPELERLKGPRLGVFQEPGKDEELNVGIFKELTGNDKFMVRGLYKNPIEIKPQTKYFCCCNELPKIGPSVDGGTARRIEVFHFGSKFVDEPEEPNEFLIDNKLKNKIEAWAPTFAGYLVHIYMNQYKKGTIKIPDAVKMSTKKYIKDQDLFRDWFDSCIIKTDSKKDIIPRLDLLNNFKDWFKNYHEGNKLPGSKKIYEFVESIIKEPCHKSGFRKLKFHDDDEEYDSQDDE